MRVLAWPRSPRKITSWPGEDGVLELRHDGVLVADDAVEQRLAGPDLGHGVAPDLFLDRDGLPAGLLQGSDRGGRASWRPTYRRAVRGPSTGAAGPATRFRPPWASTDQWRGDRGRRRAAPHVRRARSRRPAGGRRSRSPATGDRPPPSPTATARSSTAQRSTRPPAAADRRWWLRFDGLFYQGDVWLDGTYLGDTEGYFSPHIVRGHRTPP